jgi:hypothetical protein
MAFLSFHKLKAIVSTSWPKAPTLFAALGCANKETAEESLSLTSCPNTSYIGPVVPRYFPPKDRPWTCLHILTSSLRGPLVILSTSILSPLALLLRSYGLRDVLLPTTGHVEFSSSNSSTGCLALISDRHATCVRRLK